MLASRFPAAFDRLLGAWRRHDGASRAVADLPELSRARIALDDARRDVAAARDERHAAGSRPPHPHVSDDERAAYWKLKTRATLGGSG